MVVDVKNLEQRRLERIEQYQIVLVEAWYRKGFSNRAVASYTGRGESIVSKIKNGRAPICANMRQQLIDLFELDRARLFIAIEIAGDGLLYFNPTFKNACYASICFLEEMLGCLNEDVTDEQKAIFAAFSNSTLQSVVGRAGRELTTRFSTVAQIPEMMARRQQN